MKSWFSRVANGVVLVLMLFALFSSHAAPGVCADSDGDGWGWNGVESCKVGGSNSSAGTCFDSDGDGWGWNGSESCRAGNVASNASPSESSTCIDPDGDGWGWNGVESCRTAGGTDNPGNLSISNSRSVAGQHSSTTENCEKLRSGNYHITELVTDVFLTAGQSNATGGNTRYLPDTHRQDRVNNRVLAWTDNNRWEVANPKTQTWHNEIYPSGKGRIHNHPAFQIGRAIAEHDECRVVAFVATAASGMQINHWRSNTDNHYTHISDRVTSAINALPSRHKVDMIWWMQGEADNDQNIGRYFYKLTDLIAKFRGESWFQSNGYFLANETGWFTYANRAIRRLSTDSDQFTDYSDGEDTSSDRFPHIATDSIKAHFNEVALRKIGDRVADKYINEYLPVR